jgi:hypothetical protein
MMQWNQSSDAAREALSPAIVRALCLGPLAVRDPLSPDDAAMFAWLVRGGAPAVAELWREHSPFLRQDAQRQHLRPNPSDGCFYGELVERRQLQQKARQRYWRRWFEAYSVAFHEAAHAVIGFQVGLRVTHVALLQDGGGYCATGKSLPTEDHDRRYHEVPEDEDIPTLASLQVPLVDYIVMTLAGGPAMRRAGDPRGQCSRHDWLVAEKLFSEAHHLPPYHEQIQTLLQAAERQASRAVDRAWPQITAIAEQLIERGRLTGDDVRNLVRIQ